MNNKRLWHFAWWVTGICAAFAVLLVAAPNVGLPIAATCIFFGILLLICSPFITWFGVAFVLPIRAKQQVQQELRAKARADAKLAEESRWPTPAWLAPYRPGEKPEPISNEPPPAEWQAKYEAALAEIDAEEAKKK